MSNEKGFRKTVEEYGLENQPAGIVVLGYVGNAYLLEAVGILEKDSKKAVIKKIRAAIASLEICDSSLILRLNKTEEDSNLSGEQKDENFQNQGNSDRWIRKLKNENEDVDSGGGSDLTPDIEYFKDELRRQLEWVLK